MAVPSRGWEPHFVDACFRLVPGLLDLHLQYTSTPENDLISFLEVMLATERPILPNLCNLTLRGPIEGHFQYRSLILLLRDRVDAHLATHSSNLSDSSSPIVLGDHAPDAATATALRQLVEDGLTIHIGPENGNFPKSVPALSQPNDSSIAPQARPRTMASVTELHTRIAELSSSIDRQKQLLRDLERQKSDAQRDVNGILDPMARLPFEISSYIFTQCLPSSPHPDPLSAPTLLLTICRSWTNIALATPALWTSIQVEFPRAHGFEHLFDAWLKRAGTRMTSISLRGQLPRAVAVVVKEHAVQVQSLELYLRSGGTLQQIIGSFSSLKTLKIAHAQDHRDEDEAYFSGDASGCVELMRAAPNLVECIFDGLYYGQDYGQDIPEDLYGTGPFTHTSLRHLRLGGGDFQFSTAAILSHLTLPALKTLYISHFDIPHHAALSFLTRSSPPLQSLFMPTHNVDWSAHSTISSYFRLLPSLTDLELVCGYCSEHKFPFLRVLSISDNFLPKLSNLTIRDLFLDGTGYENLVSVLSVRSALGHSKIQSFRLDHRSEDELDASIIVALRQLVADGMDIHISTRDTRLV
ncbi:hypothetical protein DFH09DRAFT_1282294 [Mycena vulgaris]|nr:hypothetical protein DFH09DRAFT_1282294 [Mycena vulgaris]